MQMLHPKANDVIGWVLFSGISKLPFSHLERAKQRASRHNSLQSFSEATFFFFGI
jgi:hypothetical protein